MIRYVLMAVLFALQQTTLRACDQCGDSGIVRIYETQSESYATVAYATAVAQELNEREGAEVDARVSAALMRGGAAAAIGRPGWVPHVRTDGRIGIRRAAPTTERYCECPAGRAAAEQATTRREQEAKAQEEAKRQRAEMIEKAKSGDANAQYRLGRTIEDASFGDASSAMAWYRRAAEGGNPDAMVRLALHEALSLSELEEQTGRGGRRINDDAEGYRHAADLLRRAAQMDDGEAQFVLATLYVFGKGGARSYDEAKRWFRRCVTVIKEREGGKLRHADLSMKLGEALCRADPQSAEKLKAIMAEAGKNPDTRPPAGSANAWARAPAEPSIQQPSPQPKVPDAASLLRQARMFLRNNVPDEGKERLKELIAKYPDSPEAKDAKAELRKLE